MSIATVLQLAPMQDQSTNLCSKRSLSQSSCQRDPNSCRSTLCILDRFVFLACFRAPPSREIHSILSCRVVYPVLCLVCLWFCRPCQTMHSFGCFTSVLFSFDNLSPCDRKFHTIFSFLGTFDLDCPSPTNPSVQAVCFLMLIQRFSISFTNSVHSVVLINK